MKLCGVCIYTNNAPRLAGFYESALKESPLAEGQHYSFRDAQLSVYNPGNVNVVKDKNMSLMFYVDDVLSEHERLKKEINDIVITSPPEHKPWGAFSFWFLDPDGNTISFVEKSK